MCLNETQLWLRSCLIQDWTSSLVIWDHKIPIRILQMHFKVKSHPTWILMASDSSECQSLVTTLPCSIKTWLQRHSPFLVPWYKCFSSLVSDFYWTALSLCPCGYGKSAPAPNYPILFQWRAPFIVVYCVWWQRAGYTNSDWYFNQNCPIMPIML